MRDEREFLPRLKKREADARAPKKRIAKKPSASKRIHRLITNNIAKGALSRVSLPAGTIDIAHRIIAGTMSLAIVLGGYWLADLDHAETALVALSTTGERIDRATIETYEQFTAHVVGFLDTYVATVSDVGEGVALGVDTLVERAHRFEGVFSQENIAALGSAFSRLLERGGR
jgi:hypothetical protein